MRRTGMSRRVRAVYDRLVLWSDGWTAPGGDPQPGEQTPGAAGGPGRPASGPGNRGEKPNDFNAGPRGPGSPGGLVGHGEKKGDLACLSGPEGGAPENKDAPCFSRTDLNFSLDHLDHLDQACDFNGLSGPGKSDRP